ncbi:hypothetical protein GEMRC1_001736 [Eukaryota sp. GEM-RC1]
MLKHLIVSLLGSSQLSIPPLPSNPHIRLLLLLAFVIYGVIVIALVCEHYFMESITVMIARYKVNDDIAGAIFLAIGSSVPELFASLIALFIDHNDVGLSNIVGSTVFNILVTLGVACLFIKSPLLLDFRVVIREVLFFLVSSCLLIWALYDSTVTRLNSSVFILFYALFVTALLSSKKYFPLMEKFMHRKSQSVLRPLREHVIPMTSEDHGESHDSSGHKGLFTIPKGLFQKMWWSVCLPINMILKILIIPCSTEKTRKFYFFTFINAIIVIGVLEFFVVEAVELIGEELNFNDELTGLLLLAPFSCLPEVLTSIAVARRGMGNALISNVMGSNLLIF